MHTFFNKINTISLPLMIRHMTKGYRYESGMPLSRRGWLTGAPSRFAFYSLSVLDAEQFSLSDFQTGSSLVASSELEFSVRFKYRNYAPNS